MDKIHIRDIELKCIIGINDEERKVMQNVLINITLHTNLSLAGNTDNINCTVNYKAVKQRILGLVENSRYFLVEALAENIARECLSFDKVEQVDVLVEKPGALRFARTVGVEISRSKQAR